MKIYITEEGLRLKDELSSPLTSRINSPTTNYHVMSELPKYRNQEKALRVVSKHELELKKIHGLLSMKEIYEDKLM